MKRGSILLLLSAGLFACNKSDVDPLYYTGLNENMEVTEHNVFAQAVPEGDWMVTKSVSVDVTGEGLNDFKFVSIADSTDNDIDTEVMSYEVMVVIDNEDIQVMGELDEQIIHRKKVSEVNDYYGTYPRVVTTYEIACEDGTSSNIEASRDVAHTFSGGVEISLDSDTWSPGSLFILRQTGFSWLDNHFSAGADSLFQFIFHKETYCHSIAQNSIRYLVFKETTLQGTRLGWLGFVITDNNKVTALCSGISDYF